MKKIILSLMLSLSVIFSAFTVGTPVFDSSNWLTAIDDLYASYDMIQNTIKQIENQYKMIQQQIENYKGIDWENFQWSGSFDIRRDIKDATRRVNSFLTETRNIQQLLTTPSINVGYGSYSVADLCGINGNGKNIIAAMKDGKNYMTDNMKKVVEDMTRQMTEDEKKAIWNKYGLSPENYLFIQQTAVDVKDKASKIMVKCSDEAQKLRLEALTNTSEVINAAMETIDSEGNMTQGAFNQSNLLLMNQLVESLSRVREDIVECSSLTAEKMISDQNEIEAKLEQERIENENRDKYNNSKNKYFEMEWEDD